jgi:hypothetical protein
MRACRPTPGCGWLRAVRVLRTHGLATLADLTVRVPRRRQRWRGIPRPGQTSARQIAAFFAAHPQLIAGPLAAILVISAVMVWQQG